MISLNYSNKGWKKIPENILKEIMENKDTLRELYLDNNQLTYLPADIGNLYLLNKLHIFNNQLTSLPDTIGNLSLLQFLYLYNNQLTSLPDTIGNLSLLRVLWLTNNQLTNLPNTIGNLSLLRVLYIDKNRLTSLPNTIGNLSLLRVLWLSNNELYSLPNIENLSSITKLYLHNNYLNYLPDLEKLKLNLISIHGNKIQKFNFYNLIEKNLVEKVKEEIKKNYEWYWMRQDVVDELFLLPLAEHYSEGFMTKPVFKNFKSQAMREFEEEYESLFK